jgi:hypothetical protein
MIYSIIIWLAIKFDKRRRRVSLYQTKYDIIYITALIHIFIFINLFYNKNYLVNINR